MTPRRQVKKIQTHNHEAKGLIKFCDIIVALIFLSNILIYNFFIGGASKSTQDFRVYKTREQISRVETACIFLYLCFIYTLIAAC